MPLRNCVTNGVTCCSANGHTKSLGKKTLFFGQEVECYNSLLEYCTLVANELPQRQAFYTVDLADVLWKIQEWKDRLPNVEIFYAVKANDDPILLKLLSLLGLSFDCATQGEIQMVLSAGAPPQNIIFAHTIKTPEELRFASDVGVDLMTFDNEEELRKIQKFYPTARLLLRLSPSEVSCSFDLSDKFGCSEEEALELLQLASQLHLNVVGISFHVGALCTDPSSYTSTIRSCRRLFDKAPNLGFEFTILDIGGGFFGHIGTQDIFYKMAESIHQALDEHFPGNEVRVIAEPGCYIIASAVSLVNTVLGKRVVKNTAQGRPSRYYYLNEGVYGSFFKGIEDYGILLNPLLSDTEVISRPVLDSRLFGQTCCSEDVIRLSTPLPDMEVGERVMWQNMGAYSRGICSTFCGVPLPERKHLLLQNEKLRMDWIKNREEIVNFLKDQAVFIEKGIN